MLAEKTLRHAEVLVVALLLLEAGLEAALLEAALLEAALLLEVVRNDTVVAHLAFLILLEEEPDGKQKGGNEYQKLKLHHLKDKRIGSQGWLARGTDRKTGWRD